MPKSKKNEQYFSIALDRPEVIYEHLKQIDPMAIFGINLGTQTLRNPMTRFTAKLVSNGKKFSGYSTLAWVDNTRLLPERILDMIVPIPSDVQFLYETAKYGNGTALVLDKNHNAEYQFSTIRSPQTGELGLRIHFGCDDTGNVAAATFTPAKILSGLEKFIIDLNGFKRISEQSTNAVYSILSAELERDEIVAEAMGGLDKTRSFFVCTWAPLNNPPELPPELKKLTELKKQAEGLDSMLTQLQEKLSGAGAEEIVGTKVSDLGVRFGDVGGQEQAKYEMESLVWALKNPESYKKWGSVPPKGILLYGPPGNGKTLLAKAFASEADATFYTIKVSDIVSKWYGETEQRMAKVFEQAQKDERAVIFFDELDSLAGDRGTAHEASMKTISTMLQYLDGLQAYSNVMVLGATNRIEAIDEGMKRAGRFTKHIEVPVPDETGRLHIFRIHTGKAQQLAQRELFQEFQYDKILRATTGYSGADIAEIVRRTLEGKVRVEGKSGKEPSIVSEDDILKEISCYEHSKKKNGKIGYEVIPSQGTSHT